MVEVGIEVGVAVICFVGCGGDGVVASIGL